MVFESKQEESETSFWHDNRPGLTSNQLISFLYARHDRVVLPRVYLSKRELFVPVSYPLSPSFLLSLVSLFSTFFSLFVFSVQRQRKTASAIMSDAL